MNRPRRAGEAELVSAAIGQRLHADDRMLPVAGPEDQPALLAWTQAMQALAEADRFDQVKRIRDKAEAFRLYARSAALGFELQNKAAELRLRAERKAGQFLKGGSLWGGNRRSRCPRGTLKLSDLGITRKQSSRWQRMASVPDPDFEAFIRQCKELQREIVASSLLALAHRSPGNQKPKKGHEDLCGRMTQLVKRGERFGTIYVVPPWNCGSVVQVKGPLTDIRSAKLAQLPLREVADENAQLFILTRNECLPLGLRLINGWGFRYVSALVVHHLYPSFSSSWRDLPSFLLLGRRGKPKFGDNGIPGHVKLSCNDKSTLCELIERVSRPPYLSLLDPEPQERVGWTAVVGE